MLLPRSLTQESIVLGETNPETIENVTNLAPTSSMFEAIFSVTNNGSTQIPSAQLTIHWPLDVPGSENYFLYPIRTDGVRHPHTHTCTHTQSLHTCIDFSK